MLLPLGLPRARGRWALQGLVLIAAQTVFDLLGLRFLAGSAGALLILLSLLYVAQQGRLAWRVRRVWLRRFAELGSMRLAPPFRGEWKALRCGPNLGRNSHLAGKDQWFAVDFERVDGKSRGSEVLSPADGVVAYVEDGHEDKAARWWRQAESAHPAGNYVSIQVNAAAERGGEEPAWVILAHLEQGSIHARPGQAVRSGEPVARCGNSGQTSAPHVHVHLQAAERVEPGQVWGLPIRFSVEGEQAGNIGAKGWLRPGQRLVS